MKNSFALLILAVLTSLLLSSENVRAQSGESNSVQLLTYAELMQLSTDQRVQYIEGVRAILIDLAKRPDGKFSDRDPAAKSRLKAWLEMLDRDMKTARAEDGTNEAAPVPIQLRKPSASTLNISAPAEPLDPITQRLQNIGGGRPSATDNLNAYVVNQNIDIRLQCKSSVRTVSTPGIQGLPDCTPQQEQRIQAAFTKQKPSSSLISNILKKDSTAETAPVAPPAETTPAAALTRGLKVDKVTISGAPSTEVTGAAAPIILQPPSQPLTAERQAPGETPGTTKPTTETGVGRRVTPDEISKYVADKKESPSKMCDAGMRLVQLAAGKDSYCMTDEAEARYRLGDLKLDGDASSADPKGKARHTASAKKDDSTADTSKRGDEKKYACAPKAEVCEVPKSKASSIVPPGQHCIFAGMISTFNSGNTRCQPQTEFALADKKYTCASGQTMCNPLLFGTVNTTTPICVGHAPNATEQCSKLSSSRDAEKFLNRSENGLQEKWDNLRGNLEKVCTAGTASAKFHCAECNIIKQRIFDLHARLLSNPCGGGRSDDGANAVNLRIKLGGPKSSGTKR